MARQLWFDPANPHNFALVDTRSAVGPPAGYVMAETADGGRGGTPLTPSAPQWGQPQQQYQGGQTSGGYPAYSDGNGPATEETAPPK